MKKKSKRKNSGAMIKILLAVLIIALIAIAAVVVKMQMDYRKGAEYYGSLRDTAMIGGSSEIIGYES